MVRDSTNLAIATEQVGYTNLSIARLDALAEGVGLDCGLVSGDVLPLVGTVNTARDVNFVSEKLGEQTFAFL